LVPRRDVENLTNPGKRNLQLNTNLLTARVEKAEVLKQYLVHSPEQFKNLLANATVPCKPLIHEDTAASFIPVIRSG
jgi:hypothetical protein